MAISNQRDYVLKTKYSHHSTVALTQTVANAASADYSVADLINLVNVALTTKYNNVTTRTIGKATSTLATPTVPLALVLSSSDFTTGNALPVNAGSNAPSAADVTNPQLGWALTGTNAANVTEYRLEVVDTDASNYVHWSVSGIVNTTLAIAATSDPTTNNWAGTPTLATTGGGVGASIANGWEPCGPASGVTHTYTFTVKGYAADSTLLVTSNVLSGTYTG